MRILIIDDDRMLGENLSELLKFQGHSTKVVNTLKEYLEIEELLIDYDAVILDLMIPKILDENQEFATNGLEVGEVIYNRIIEKHPQMRILVISGKDRRFCSINMNGDNSVYLKKPTDTKAENIFRHLENT